MTASVDRPIRYGTEIPTETDLRLLGDVSGGKRVLELGVSEARNSIAFALAGSKAIAVDPDPDRIEALRAEAASLDEVFVECHVIDDLADLGFATSGSIEAAVAHHTLHTVDDLGRTLRQVHRVLKASHPLVMSIPHPFASVYRDHPDGRQVTPYGSACRTFGDWFTQLARTNFRVDQVLELGVSPASPVPTTLVIRARKEGD